MEQMLNAADINNVLNLVKFLDVLPTDSITFDVKIIDANGEPAGEIRYDGLAYQFFFRVDEDA